MKNEVFVVYSQKLAGHLMVNGFKLISMKRNKIHKNYNVFLFAKTDKLLDSVYEFTGVNIENGVSAEGVEA